MEKIHGEELILGFTLRVLPQFGHGLCVCDPTWWWANVQVKCMTVYAPLPPKLRRCSLIVSAGYSMRKKSRQRRVSKWQNWAGTSVFYSVVCFKTLQFRLHFWRNDFISARWTLAHEEVVQWRITRRSCSSLWCWWWNDLFTHILLCDGYFSHGIHIIHGPFTSIHDDLPY